MAKSSVQRDRFINRYRGRLSTTTTSSAVVVESFNTGMNVGRTDPMKWVITHFAIWPNKTTVVGIYAATGDTLTAQLLIGTQTALLDGDDMQVICEAHMGQSQGSDSAGNYIIRWPLQAFLPAPIPVFAQTLTVAIQALTDQTYMDSKEFVYEIGYVQAPISQDEIVEYLSAYGQV